MIQIIEREDVTIRILPSRWEGMFYVISESKNQEHQFDTEFMDAETILEDYGITVQ